MASLLTISNSRRVKVNGNKDTTLFVISPDSVPTVTAGDYTITSGSQFVKLPAITANQNITLPSTSTYKGEKITIWNQNTAAFAWNFPVPPKKADGTNYSTIPNQTIIILQSDGGNWIKIN